MKYGNEQGQEFLEGLHVRLDLKIRQIHQLLVPDCEAAVSIDDLGRLLAHRLEGMTVEQQTELKIRAAAAMVELDRIVEEMKHHMSAMSREVVSVKKTSSAMGAYGRTVAAARSTGSSAW